MPSPNLFGFLGEEQALADVINSMSSDAARARTEGRGAVATEAGVLVACDGLLVGFIGQPRVRSTGNESVEAAAEQLARAYRRDGSAALQRLEGAFALAMLDCRTAGLLLATDRLGQYPLVWQASGETLIFSTDARRILQHPAARHDINPQGLYDYLYHHMVAAPTSIHAGCERLQAGQYLEWRPGQSAQVRSYWVPEFAHGDAAAPPQGELLESLRGAVGRATAAGDRVGAFLSGGLDSTTLAGLLAEQRPDSAPTFSIGFQSEGYDELEYARAAASHFGNPPHEYTITPGDIAAALPEVATAYDEPFGNSSALPALICARMARSEGITRLLAGDGGDELFAGNARYAKQLVFERYARLPGGLRGVLTPLLTRLPNTRGLVGKARRYVEQAETPLPDRLQSYNYLHRHAPAEVFHPDLLAEVDTGAPLHALREVYHRPQGADAVQRMLYLDWQVTLADNDLRKVRRMCELAGVDVVFPFLDSDVVDFATRVPSRELLAGGDLRHYYREAMRGFLPESTLTKSKHGFGLPFGVWLRDDPTLHQMAGDALTDLAQRRIFRADFLTEVQRLHAEEHAAFYGELVWLLMVLEMWLTDAEREGSTRRSASAQRSPTAARSAALRIRLPACRRALRACRPTGLRACPPEPRAAGHPPHHPVLARNRRKRAGAPSKIEGLRNMRSASRFRSTAVSRACSQAAVHSVRMTSICLSIIASAAAQPSWNCGAASRQVARVLARRSPTISMAWLATLPVRACGQISNAGVRLSCAPSQKAA